MTHRNVDGGGKAHHVGPCVGKVGYLDGDLASRAAQQLANDLNVRVNVYQCHLCGELHVGKSVSGRFMPDRTIEPEKEGEYHELVTKKRAIEGILGELRYGTTAGKYEKKHRLVGQLSALDMRLSELKKLRREAAHERLREDIPSQGTQTSSAD